MISATPKHYGMAMNGLYNSVIDTFSILENFDSENAVRIKITGDANTGRTTLAKVISHIIHTYTDQVFQIKSIKPELYDAFLNNLDSLSPSNYIFIFEDSPQSPNIDSNKIKNKQFEDSDTINQRLIENFGGTHETIFIYIDHYSNDRSKYATFDQYFFTSIDKDFLTSIATQTEQPAMTKYFLDMHQSCIDTQKFVMPFFDKRCTLEFNYKDPFAPILYFNNDLYSTLMVSPTLVWIDDMCSVCNNVMNQKDSL